MTVWDEINSRPSTLKPFGSALNHGRIVKPPLITQRTAKFTRPELLRAMRLISDERIEK